MKVLYDYQIFQIQKFGGISRGLAEIISHFPSDIAYDIAIKESDNVYLKEYNLDNNHPPISYQFSDFLPNVSFKGKRRIYNILSQRGWINSSDSINLHHSIEKIKKEDYDVFHPTYFSTYFLKHIRKPFVLTVHDLTAENFPLYFNKFDYQKEGRKRLVPLASHIVVPSLSTKIDVMQNWNISEGRISVIYWGGVSVNNKKYPDSIGCPYILYVGLRGGYKNFYFFIKSALPFLQKNKEVKIVCTGCNFTKSEIKFFQELHIANRVQAKFVSTEELSGLYSNALCYAFPSLSEGFGLPILEAFSCGCPVLLSNKTCFPEIGGDAAFYFNEHNGHSDISEKLDYIFNMTEGERLKTKDKGYERLTQFSWEKSATEYAQVYKSLL